MKQTYLLAALSVYATTSGATSTENRSYCPPTPATPEVQQAIFNQFVYSFYTEKNLTAAYYDFVSTDYIQHNPAVLDGIPASLAFLLPIWPSQNLTILHQTFANNIGLVHYKDVGFAPLPTAIADIYRMQGTCIMEHWDIIETLPMNATNPHALF